MGSPPKPKYFTRSILLTLGLLILPLVKINLVHPLLDAFGRFHPLVVHFPIVLILVTAIFEWLEGHSQSHHIQRILSSLYSLSLASSLLALLVGYLLYQNGDYEGAYISKHFWSGVILTILVIWSRLFRRAYLDRKKWRVRQVYRALIFAAFFGVVYTSHLGGSITHGPEYLTEPIDKMIYQQRISQTSALKEPASLNIYSDIIQPIFKAKCIKCHNDAKTKGGYNMTSLAQLKKGGKSEKRGVVADSLNESELFVRVSLPEDHADFMPPDGKTPLDEDELNLIAWWINSGANDSDSLGSVHIDSTVQVSLDRYLPKIAAGQLAQSQNQAARKKISPKLIRLGTKNGFKIQSDPNLDSVFYTVSMQIPPQPIGDREISALLPYRDLFSKISLVGANISEEGLYYLSQMPHLREIILVKCCVKGEGLVHLSSLPKLELLNLSYTDLNNENAMHLTSFPSLREVYLFDTFVEPQVVQLLDQYLTNTKVCFEEGPYF